MANTTQTSLPGSFTTSPVLTSIPINLLDSFLPGYSIISKFLLDTSGFDVTLLVSTCFLIFAFFGAIKYIGDRVYEFWSIWFMSSVTITSDDSIYQHVMRWIEEKHVIRDSRFLSVKSRSGSGRESQVRGARGGQGTTSTMSELYSNTSASSYQNAANGLFNFSEWEAQIPPRYQPDFGRHTFWHKGHHFIFRRDTKTAMKSNPWRGLQMDEKENVTLTCLGRSTDPIKALLQEAKKLYLSQQKSMTAIKKPNRNYWQWVSSRPSRPMDTLALSADQKTMLLEDINQYLHPSSPRWYANRGIPYRRGYLFHGEPGTGKTSLSFALAGVFGLDIHVISLVDPEMTEDRLSELFINLPFRCVVLLEDIDTAGLDRKVEPPKDAETTEAKTRVGRGRRIGGGEDGGGISLSGLLNAIDGVASQEGRILVMTTNKPEALDEALIRPGRVDVQIKFGLATKDQMEGLFIRMYTVDPHPEDVVDGELMWKASDELLKKAKEFAAELPQEKFTPAEVQGYLLMRRSNMQKALDDVKEWRDILLKAKDDQTALIDTASL